MVERLTIHQRLCRLWGSLDQLLSDSAARYDGSVDVYGGGPRWRSIPWKIYSLREPLRAVDFNPDAANEPVAFEDKVLLSISYKLYSGKVCYLDDEITDPLWNEGAIAS